MISRHLRSKARGGQYGFTLMEMMLVIALIAIVSIGVIQEQQRQLDFAAARSLGKQMATYNNAVRSYIATFGGQITVGNVPAELTGNKVGVDWLKSATCNVAFTADKDYLPCSFLQDTAGLTRFGQLQFESYLDARWDAGTEAGVVDVYTVMVDPATGDGLSVRGNPAPALSGIATLMVEGIAQLANSPIWVATDGEAVFCLTAASRPGVCDAAVLPTPTYSAAKMVMVARNNAATDSWLRTDGGNTMGADLSFDDTLPFANRDIVNVGRIFSTTGEGIQLGDAGNYAGGPAAADVVVVDSDLELWGDLFITGSMTITDGDFTVQNGSVIATAGGRPNSGDFQGHRFVDLDDVTFVVDPAGNSRIRNLQSDTIANNLGGSALTLSTQANANGAGNAAGGSIIIDSADGIDAGAATSINLTTNNGVNQGAILMDSTGINATHTLDVNLTADQSASFTADGGATGLNLTAGGIASLNAAAQLDLNTEFTNINVLVDGVSQPLTGLLPNWQHYGTYAASLSRATSGATVSAFVPQPICLPGWDPKITVLPVEITTETISGATTSSSRPSSYYHRPGKWNYSVAATVAGPSFALTLGGPPSTHGPTPGVPAATMRILASTYCYRSLK